MHRRTVLKFAAGAAGAAIVGASTRPAPAAAAGPFVELAGWPKAARFDAIETGRSGSWAIGFEELRETPDDWRRRAILRRLQGRTWAPVALPDSFLAWGKAIAPDADGLWIVGQRNDVTLPVHDGSTVVGHLGHDGRWRTLDTASLPRYADYGSLLLINGRIELTGYRPAETGVGFRPYCLSRPLHAAAAARWTEQPVDEPGGVPSELQLLKVGSGTTDWATAGTRLLRRTRSGWTAAASPPGTENLWHYHCAAAGRFLYLITLDPARSAEVRLFCRAGSNWTEIALPPFLRLHRLAVANGVCWAVGAQHPSMTEQPNAITVLRLSGSKITRRLDGPKGMADLACVADRKLLLSGIVPDPADEEGGWIGRPFLLRG